MKALSWINFVLGLWLILAGFTLAFGTPRIMSEEIVLGIVIAAFAWWSAVHPANPAPSWIVAIAGLWTLIAPAVIHYGDRSIARTNDMTIGIVVLVLGFWSAVYRRSPVRTDV